MKYSIAIMAHPSRRDNVEKLKSVVGSVPVSWNDNGNIWSNRVTAELLYDPEADYHLVLQDDAVLCDDFLEELDKLLKHDMAYSLYFGNRMTATGDHVLKDKLHWGVAVALPTRIITDMVSWCNKLDSLGKHDDTRISKYLQHIGMPVYYPIPSLVDHLEGDSLVGDTGSNRRAYKFKDNYEA